MSENTNEDPIEVLRRSDIKCPKFTLAGEARAAKIVAVYDGDTARANLYLREGDREPVQLSLRFVGYDTAEMKSSDAAERRKAERARDAVRRMCMGRMVRVEIEGLDKYGRTLARVFVRRADGKRDEFCVNDWMIENGLGVPYDGGRKGDVMVGGDGSSAAPPATCDLF